MQGRSRMRSARELQKQTSAVKLAHACEVFYNEDARAAKRPPRGGLPESLPAIRIEDTSAELQEASPASALAHKVSTPHGPATDAARARSAWNRSAAPRGVSHGRRAREERVRGRASAFPDRLHVRVKPLLRILEEEFIRDRQRLHAFAEGGLDRGLGLEINARRLPPQ